MDTLSIFLSIYFPVILCIVAGIALMTTEIFIPGFGFPGITGFILLVAACVLTWINFGSNVALLVILGIIILTTLCLFFAFKSIKNGKISRSKLILNETTGKSDEPTEGTKPLIGKKGEVLTTLRPAGFALIDGERVNVVTLGSFIEKGEMVQVSHIEGAKIIVERAENDR